MSLVAAVTFALLATAEPTPAPPDVNLPDVKVAPAAPALAVDSVVTDRTGAVLGPIVSMGGTGAEVLVIIKIDGKLVGVPAPTLKQNGAATVSSQSKAEILKAANAQ